MLNFFNFSVKFIIIFLIVILLFAFSTLWYFSIGLPDYKKLSNYQPPISSRVYSEDGKLIAEYILGEKSNLLQIVLKGKGPNRLPPEPFLGWGVSLNFANRRRIAGLEL